MNYSPGRIGISLSDELAVAAFQIINIVHPEMKIRKLKTHGKMPCCISKQYPILFQITFRASTASASSVICIPPRGFGFIGNLIQ